MSLQSWKKEFYPVEAEDVAAATDSGDLVLLNHSLQKWIGLRDENMIKHNVYKGCSVTIYDSENYEFEVNSKTCALCHIHYRFVDGEGSACKTCPLFKVRGSRCDILTDEEEVENEFGTGAIITSPWDSYVDNEDPEPMIKLIEEAIEIEKGQNRK